MKVHCDNLWEGNGNYLYRNNYCLPLGYMMSEKAIRGWESSMLDRIGSLNSLAQQLGAKGDMLYPAACTEIAGEMGDKNN